MKHIDINPKRLHIVACGVLRIDLEEIARRLGVPWTATYLEGGLHSDPAELRRRLQAAIDAASDGNCDAVVVGYGLCGRGTVGIRATDTPLLIPRVHDCISLFLGSDQAFRREFSSCPGTYYISAGWYEEKVQPRSEAAALPGDARHEKDSTDASDREQGTGTRIGNPNVSPPAYEELVARYGTENADEIRRFLNSWQRNYSRSVFIDTGVGDRDKYEQYADAMAKEFGWEYRKLAGEPNLMERLLAGDTAGGDVLLVPPGNVTFYDAKERRLSSAPANGHGLKNADPTRSSQTSSPAVSVGSTGRTLFSKGDGAEDAAKRDEGRDEFEDRGSETDPEAKQLGLGIDAGGTYTDAVIFDFRTRRVLDKAKALTTKWDYSVGIDDALNRLDGRWFENLSLVSVSTTLATNAIVEETGQKTGLFLMPSMRVDLSEFHDPAVVVSGRMDISGKELAPVDPDEVREKARKMIREHEVKAFAVSGYAGAVNPQHELEVKRILREETRLDVCCGHELSDLLDFRVRANTAVLNAGIIPLLERFLTDIEKSMSHRGVSAPVMVVRGDGTLMRADYAREHPVETILSGPAASVAGARYLTGCTNATIVDVGGTTSDIGNIRSGAVSVCTQGAVVGKYRTHVRAVDMRTLGLGGDSEIYFEKQRVYVGPKRIAPVSWLATRADCTPALDYISQNAEDFVLDSRPTELFALTGRTPTFEPDSQEKAVMQVLAERPCSAAELVQKTGAGHILFLRLKRLEYEYVIQRCGLTPTDLLHLKGEVDLWDGAAAAAYADIVATIADTTSLGLQQRVFSLVTEKLILELVKSQLGLDNSDDGAESQTGEALLANLIAGGNDGIVVRAELKNPLIGLGAAARYFLGDPALKLTADLSIPENADVANAVGAVTSLVRVSRRGSIVPGSDGLYALTGVAGNNRFKDFQEAHDRLVSVLSEEVRGMAAAAGTLEREVSIEVQDRMTRSADGAELFLERSVVAEVTGAPVSV